MSRAYSNLAWQGWATETSPVSGVNLEAVWGSAETNMYAVGANGTILFWNGTSWSAVTSQTTNTLRAVWGTGSNNIYAVGDSGTILHYVQ
jgi:hypothetical protein